MVSVFFVGTVIVEGWFLSAVSMLFFSTVMVKKFTGLFLFFASFSKVIEQLQHKLRLEN